MAIIEQNALIRVKDAQKNSYLVYPITKAENVDGLTEALAPLASIESMNNAKSEAISTAAADATSKANQAVTDSKAYTDDEVAKDRSRLSALETTSATHALASDVTALASRLSTAEGEIDTLQSDLDTKADSDHNHDDRYYTETEIDSKLSGKSDTNHMHTNITNGTGIVEVVTTSEGFYGDTAVQVALVPSLGNGAQLSGLEYGMYNAAHLGSETNPWGTLYMSTADGVGARICIDGTYYSIKTDMINQNSFSKVVVGSTTIEADNTTDTLTLAAGSNITLTPDASGDKVTIAATDTVYTHPNSGVTAGTYKSVTVNAQGHVTAGTNPTTLAGYGITDAEAKGAAATALSQAKTYADSAATTAANNVKNDLLNGAGTAYDTLKELGDLIDTNTDAIDALETVAAGKADASHSHVISDVTGLQTALNGKAASSHGTHVSYSTTAPVMDGTASAGTASTVARSDHKHPTDTSRAAKTDLDSHTSNTTVHITSTERTNWNAAKTHADSAHAPSNAEKNQNAFSNVVVGSTTIAADSATDTLTLAGSNVTITPDATNDKVTIGITKANVTSALGYTPPTTNTTYSAATTSAAGLMSASDKSKLDGIASGANAYSLPTASSSTLGGVKTTSSVTSNSGYTACPIISGVPYYKDTNTTYTSLKNPYAVTIQGNGTSLGTYDGSAAKTFNITPSNIGAAASSHTHGELTPVTTSGTGEAYTATVSGITALTAGVSFIMVPNVVSTSTQPTLNVNSLGAKYIRRRLSTSTGTVIAGNTVSWLTAGKPVRVIYDGTYWVVDITRPSATDIYGAVPIASGGTGSTNGATGLANLFAAGNTILSSYQYGSSLPTAGTAGRIFFKKV